MEERDLKDRTYTFALRVYKLLELFPKTKGADNISYQLYKSSAPTAANYRASVRAKSRPDYTNKHKIVLEEVDESNFWLCFARDVGILNGNEELDLLIKESEELTAIFAKSVKTLSAQ
jgi:four helix bundle protein